MQKTLLVILALSLTLFNNCASQNFSYFTIENSKLTIEFYPSFLLPSRFVLERRDNVNMLSLEKILMPWHKNPKMHQGFIAENLDSLLIDRSSAIQLNDKSIVNVFTKHIETVTLGQQKFNDFYTDIKPEVLSNYKTYRRKIWVDGIGVWLKIKSDKVDNRFYLESPDPLDSSGFEIVVPVFELMESTFKTQEAINYIELLKGYFDFGLLVKHISDNPIEYRFYSHLSANEADEFYDLLESLPRDSPIVLDLSNFLSGMGTMFYKDFRRLINENPDVFWIVSSDYVKMQLREIGVKRSRMFKDRNALLRKIKNAP